MMERDPDRGSDARRVVAAALFACAGAAAPCAAQQPPAALWSQHPPIGAHLAEHSYVEASGALVTLGYKGRGLRTWRYQQGWSEVVTEHPPDQIRDASFAYDAGRQRLVMFGGRYVSSVAVTAEFDGTTWSHLTPSVHPPRRTHAAMAYDPTLQRVVLHGGVDVPWNAPAAHLSDTWDFDGITWNQRSATNAPQLEPGALMVFDTTLQQLLLVGRAAPVGTARAQTWTYDGTTWSQIVTSQAPPHARDARMAHDPVAGETVLFAGRVPAGGQSAHETWSFDGVDWTQQSTVRGPRGYLGRDLTYSQTLGGLVCVGGLRGGDAAPDVSGALVRYAAGTWTSLTPDVPFTRRQPHLAYDSSRGCLVLHGGTDEQGNATRDTFEWRPATGWLRTATNVGPGEAIVYDAKRQCIVSVAAGQTWEYDAAGWRAPAYLATPPVGALWYDRKREQVRAAHGSTLSTLWPTGSQPGWAASNANGVALPTGPMFATYWGAFDVVVAMQRNSPELYQLNHQSWDRRTGWSAWTSNLTELPIRGELLIGDMFNWGSIRFHAPWTPSLPWVIAHHLQLGLARPHEAVVHGAWATDAQSGQVYGVGTHGEVWTIAWPGNPSVTRLDAGCNTDTLALLYPVHAGQMPPAWLGGTMPLLLTGLDPQPGLVVLALGPSYGSGTNVNLPISLTPVGIHNCVAWSTLDVLLPYAHTGNGLVINLPMPSAPGFAGVPFAVQAYLPPTTYAPFARVTDALLVTAY